MTATIGEQITRIRRLIQDEGEEAFVVDKVLTQHQDEITRIARQRRVGDITVHQGVAGTGLYTIDAVNVEVMMVLYGELRLDFATEEFLDRKYKTWEYPSSREPKYWTTNNQDPNVVRIEPAPNRTGSLIPVIPPAPFITNPIDNFTFFFYRDFANLADDEADVLPLMDVWEDVLVWRTSAELGRREGTYQNLPLTQTTLALADMWVGLIDSPG